MRYHHYVSVCKIVWTNGTSIGTWKHWITIPLGVKYGEMRCLSCKHGIPLRGWAAHQNKKINKTHDWNQDLYSICAPQEKINLGQTEEKSTHKLCHYQPPQEVMSELQIRFGLEFLAVEFGSLPDRKKGLYSDHITSEKYYVQDDSTNISTQFPPFHQDTINSTKLSTSLWSMSISKVELWLSQLPWSFWSIGGTWRSQIIWPLSWRLNTWRHSKWMSR